MGDTKAPRIIAAVAVATVALLACFLGFNQCGGYRWMNDAVAASIGVVVVLAAAVRARRQPASDLARRLRSQLPFAMIAVLTLIVAFKIGEFLYSPPASLRDWLSLGGC
jgi:energy-coupling factor transporter transmembrane protein EcfT